METESNIVEHHRKTIAFFIRQTGLAQLSTDIQPQSALPYSRTGTDGDYLHTFQKLTEITETPNDHHRTGTVVKCAADLQFTQYAGCQIRGGDKITETNLLPPEQYIRLIKEKTALRDVFVLTDDYRLFEQVQTLAPDIHWYTLCSPDEKGYVTSAFTQTTKRAETADKWRFLSSIQILMDASRPYREASLPAPACSIEEILSGHQSGRLSAQGLSASIVLPISQDLDKWPPNLCKAKLKVIVLSNIITTFVAQRALTISDEQEIYSRRA